ncbi:MAG: dynamin family protein [Magnetococcales bacterium]|nr:dynamin family protein [Magnetococcales bacterium]
MIGGASTQIEKRLQSLEKHLRQENPVLLQAVQGFRELDGVAYRMGLLTPEESYATRVPWWPLVSVLGTFSSGKSTFLNSYLGRRLQRTGNQAVDDKFTVVCYSKEDRSRTLPGLALDADPRFPFYQISQEIEKVAEGEGRRIDAYLQLKTCPSEMLRGKILIDSPGFDADAQRTSTLRITDHIMDLSDLVLVFFDARHPEPGAMKDTLEHLVQNTIHRHDSNKFLFILNQVDCTVQEDNLEDVVAAWQRAISQAGLTAGRFYQIYNLDAAYPIHDDTVRVRYETKQREDMADILERMQHVEVERAYRIIGVLEHSSRNIEEEVVPKMRDWIARWRRITLIGDGILAGAGLVLLLLFLGAALPFPSWETLSQSGPLAFVIAALALTVGGLLHYQARGIAAKLVMRQLTKECQGMTADKRESMQNGFRANTRPWRSIFYQEPVGWNARSKRRILGILKETDMFVQNLNDQFTNPSGKQGAKNPRMLLDVN